MTAADRRLALSVPADVYAALEVAAERRDMTAVSLAGVVLTGWAATVDTGAVCMTIGHGSDPAAGVASMVNYGPGASWHPYCADCLDAFARGGDPVRRYDQPE